jgi:hypothetical protein
MKADGRPLLKRFRRLARAPRDRVSIQRRSAQRLTLTAAAVLGTLTLVALSLDSPPGRPHLVPKEKPGLWTHRRAFGQVKPGTNIQLLSFSLVSAHFAFS